MICVTLSAYFIYHSLNGRFGLTSFKETNAKTRILKNELAALRKEREQLSARVKLLKPGSIEKDMLDEQARYYLDLIHEDEIVIMR